jgi:glycosyltransferase involved in cell wall biosynthesis
VNIVIFLSYGISMKKWHDLAIISRELKLYRELSTKYNISFTFITYGDKSDLQFSDMVPNCKILPIYTLVRYSNYKLIRFLKSIYIPLLIKNKIPIDAIFKTNQMWGSWVAVITKFVSNRPLLLRCGFELYQNQLIEGGSFYKKIIFKVISIFSYKNADLIIVTSKEIEDFIVSNFNLSRDMIEILPNWIDMEIFKKSRTSFIPNRILMVGRLSKEKNIIQLLKAAKNSNLSIDIVGSGILKEELRNFAKKNDINVKFLGFIDNNELPQIYNSYSIYVLCSNYEGNPKTLLEAMACELAVIGTNVQGINNIIVDKLNGLLVPLGDEKSLNSAIKKLLNNENLRSEYGMKAREWICTNNSLSSILKQEYSIYSKLYNKVI